VQLIRLPFSSKSVSNVTGISSTSNFLIFFSYSRILEVIWNWISAPSGQSVVGCCFSKSQCSSTTDMPNPTNLRRRSWVNTRARGAKWFLLIASLRHTTLIVIIFTDYASNKMQYVCYTILCITLCITNGDFRAFCVTQRTSVTHGRKIKTSDNSLIITRLPRAENGTRTRDLNLGKVALSSPQNAARLGVTNWAISRYTLCRVFHSHPKIGL